MNNIRLEVLNWNGGLGTVDFDLSDPQKVEENVMNMVKWMDELHKKGYRRIDPGYTPNNGILLVFDKLAAVGTKRIRMSGTSMAVNVTEQCRELDIEPGEDVLFSMQRI